MERNIVIAGATFNGVPSIEIPTSGGGSASFVEVSDTTATAADVAQGKYFYTANGVKMAGTGEGGGGEGPVYSGTSAPDSSIGQDEDLYIQYAVKTSPFDHTYEITPYRKVNGVWVPYTAPVFPTKGVHIWTKSTGGTDAAMYVQNGYWDVDNNIFVETGEVESVIYTSVKIWATAKDCNGIALLAYPSNWQIKASATVTDGTNTYQPDATVAQWGYGVQRDIYLWKSVS